MNTRQETLAKITELMEQHNLTLKDIATALKVTHTSSLEGSASVMTSVFNYIGCTLFFAGLYVYLYMHWLEIGSAERIMLTLGTGFCFFLLGTAFFRIEKLERMATPLFIASALLQPWGIIVTLKEYADGGDFAYGLLFMSLVMFLQQGLVFYALRSTFLAFTSIIFGTAFFAIAFDLMGMNLHIEGILLSLSLISIGWILDNSRHKAIAGIPYLFGGLALLFTTWDWIHDKPYEIVFLGVSCSIIPFSVIARSRTLLILGIFTTMSYIVSYTTEHLAKIVAWPFILMFIGIIVIGFSILAMKINKKYL